VLQYWGEHWGREARGQGIKDKARPEWAPEPYKRGESEKEEELEQKRHPRGGGGRTRKSCFRRGVTLKKDNLQKIQE